MPVSNGVSRRAGFHHNSSINAVAMIAISAKWTTSPRTAPPVRMFTASGKGPEATKRSMSPIFRPNATVRIIANKMSSVPLIAVAMAIGRSMDPPVRQLELRRQLASHQLREKAFVRGAKIGKANRLRPSAVDEVENHCVPALGADRHCEQLGLVRDGANAVRVGGRHDVAALVLAEQDSSRVRDLRNDRHRQADVPGKRHLGDGDRSSAVRAIVHGGDQALRDQLSNAFARALLSGEIDRRWSALAAAVAEFEP